MQEADDQKNGKTDNTAPVSLGSLFWIFFRIAATSFGGFMSMIAVIQNVVVERKKLLTHEQMLDGISLASLLPGPVAVNTVVYAGYLLRGGIGALVGAFAAVLPAFLFMVSITAAYFHWGQIPSVSRIFMGFMPAVAAIIVATAWNMSRKSIGSTMQGAIALVAGVTLLLLSGFFSTVLIIVGSGVVGWLLYRKRDGSPTAPAPTSDKAADKKSASGASPNRMYTVAPLAAAVPWWSFDPGILGQLLVVFGGMSVMLFGGGYVFIPLIQQVVVEGHGWVTRQEFVDSIAIGQITPGPILVSAAFMGFKVAGLAGAIVATLGIYTPPALLMVASSRALNRIKRSSAIQAALRGVRPAVIGMIFAAAIVIGKGVVPAWPSAVIFAAVLYAVLWRRIEVVWVIPPAGIAGLLFY